MGWSFIGCSIHIAWSTKTGFSRNMDFNTLLRHPTTRWSQSLDWTSRNSNVEYQRLFEHANIAVIGQYELSMYVMHALNHKFNQRTIVGIWLFPFYFHSLCIYKEILINCEFTYPCSCLSNDIHNHSKVNTPLKVKCASIGFIFSTCKGSKNDMETSLCITNVLCSCRLYWNLNSQKSHKP